MAETNQPGHAVAVHLDRLLSQLRRAVPRAWRRGEVNAIHDARVTVRRLSAMALVFHAMVDDAPGADRLLRRLRRRLGPLRDGDVLLENLAAVNKGRLLPAATWLTKRLQARRRKLLTRGPGRSWSDDSPLRGRAWSRLRDELLLPGPAVSRSLQQALRRQLQDFVRSAEALSGHAETRSATTPEFRRKGPHAVRTAAKHLRYTVEIARAARYPGAALLIRSLKAMQLLLGEWHDHTLLVECLLRHSVKAGLAYRDPEMLRAAVDLARATSRKAQTYLDRFNRLWDLRRDAFIRRLGRLLISPARPIPLSARDA